MRQIFFNPIIFLPVAAIGVIYLILLSSWVTHRKNEHTLRWLTTFLFLFTGLNLTIFPFTHIYPEALAGFDKTPGSAFTQLSIYACVVLVLINWFKDFFQNFLSLGKSPFLFGFLIVTLLSAFWSETPELSISYSLVVFFTSLFAVHIAREYTFKDLSVMLRRLTLVVAIASLLMGAAAPSLAFNVKGLSGIMPFPIKLATCLAFGAALWLSYALDTHKDRRMAIGVVGFLTLVIPLTNSAQGIFTYFVLLALVILLHVFKVFGAKYLPVLVIGYLMLGIINSVVLEAVLPLIFNALGKDATLTGRTDFWPQLLDRLEQHNLWLGYGMNSFWQPWRGQANPANGILNSSGFVPPHAHNGFIDLALSVGLIGFILFALSLLLGLARSVQYFLLYKSSDASLPLIIMIYLVFSNISETQLVGSNYIWILYVITLTRLKIGQPKTIPQAVDSQKIVTLPHPREAQLG